MKRLIHILIFSCTVAMSQLIVSCGIIDIDINEDDLKLYDMCLNHDSVYVMLDDTFKLLPIFTPDTIKFKEVFFWSNNDSIAYINDETIVASAPGETYIIASSMFKGITDSCYVYVMPKWETSPGDTPYETVVYADVKINGETPDENILIGAFRGNEFRSLGVWREWKGVKYMEFRIQSDYDGSDINSRERIRFLYYDREQFKLRQFKQRIEFDGETHGTLSNLFELTIP